LSVVPSTTFSRPPHSPPSPQWSASWSWTSIVATPGASLIGAAVCPRRVPVARLCHVHPPRNIVDAAGVTEAADGVLAAPTTIAIDRAHGAMERGW
jgi:hypothetical protein